MTDIFNNPSPKTNKKILPRMSILILFFLVLLGAFGYIYYFQPSFLSNKFKTRNNKTAVVNNSSENQTAFGLVAGGGLAGNQSTESLSLLDSFQNKLKELDNNLKSLKNTTSLDYLKDKLNISDISGDLEIQDNLIVNSTAKMEDIIPQSDDNYDLGSSSKGWDNAYIHSLHGSSILTIGDGSTSHGLTDTDDLLISGNMEVDGNTFLDGNITFGGTIDAGNNIISNLADPVSAQDAVTKAYYEANTPSGVFSRIGDTISPTAAGDLDMTGGLITFDSLQTFGGSTLSQLGYLSGLSGLGSLAEQAANSVSITGGSLSSITSLNGINSTTLGYLSGVTSGIQTQFSGIASDLSGKQNTLSAASASSSGYLTSADWSTFNGKQNLITAGISGQYYRWDKTFATLNQAAVAGLTASDSPTFAGATVSTGGVSVTGASTFNDDVDVLGGMDITGMLGVSDTLTVTSGGMDITGDSTLSGNLSLTTDSVSPPTLLCTANIMDAMDVVVNGNLAYVVSTNSVANKSTSYITTVDITDCSIKGVFAHEELTNPHSMDYSAGFLYVGAIGSNKQNNIMSLDVRGNGLPKFASMIYTAGYAGGKPVKVSGNYLVSADYGNGVAFFDISDPYDMKYLGSVKDTGTACGGASCFTNVQSLYFEYPYVLVGNSSQTTFSIVSIKILPKKADGSFNAKIVDVLYPLAGPVVSDELRGCNNTTCYFPIIYGSAGTGGISSVDVSDKENLRLIQHFSTLPKFGYNSVFLSGNVLWAADEGSSVFSAFDVSNPANMSRLFDVTVASGSDQPHTIFAEGQKLFVIDNNNANRTTGHLSIYEIKGLKAEVATIGNLKSTNISVDNLTAHRTIRGDKNLELGGSAKISGNLAIGQGIATASDRWMKTPSMSFDAASTNFNTVNNFYVFEDKLFAAWEGFAGAQVSVFPSATGGQAWDSFSLSTLGGSGAFETTSAICEFNSDLYVGLGYNTGDGKLAYCDTACDANGDFADSGFTNASLEAVNRCIGYKQYLYAGVGNDLGDGDIYKCNPAAAGNAGKCDSSSDWTLSYNGAGYRTSAFQPHGDYMYVGENTSATSLVTRCSTASGGVCAWTTALSPATRTSLGGSTTIINSLESTGGCLYASGGGEIYRCCEGDGLCEDNTNDWKKYFTAAGQQSTDLVKDVKGSLFMTGQAGGAGKDLNAVDANSDTGTSQATSVWDIPSSSYRGINAVSPVYHGAVFMGMSTAGSAPYGDIYTLPVSEDYFSTYRGDTTAGNGVSSIVGYVSQTAQTSAVAEANIFIPPVDGFYRIGIYQAVTAYTSGTLQATINFSDDIGATTKTSTALSSSTRSNDSFIIYAKANDPISYSIATGGGTMTYSAYISVERLN